MHQNPGTMLRDIGSLSGLHTKARQRELPGLYKENDYESCGTNLETLNVGSKRIVCSGDGAVVFS
jgi:hypothetical protein